MPTCLVTGANRGIGLEFARQYAADGWRVIATCREPERAEALRRIEGTVETHRLDVADFARIEALADALKGVAIDLLINNAGIYGPRVTPYAGVDYGAWAEVLRVNAMAPLKVSAVFADHVGKSVHKRIVALSSLMGSVAENTSGGAYIYRSSKAALNAVMRSLAIDLKERGVTVAILHPGWVRTDMGGSGAQIEVFESVTGMREVIDRLTLDLSGRFYGFDGREILF
jgi:NAD(P)-dependent dehydrogenase (short-subunit alcohol dehydrogenase family)